MFLRSNSGLDSRFKKKIEFKDYNGKELTEIFLNMVKRRGCPFRTRQRARSENILSGCT